MDIMFSLEPMTPEFAGQAMAMMQEFYHKTPAHSNIPEYDFNWSSYKKLDDAGMLNVFTARDGDSLIGFALYIVVDHPHHMGTKAAECDAIAIDMHKRGHGIGRKLYECAESVLREQGVKFVTNRYRVCYGVEPLFPKLGFKLIEHVYMKEL